MKVRIKDNSLRIRLSVSELTTLKNGEPIDMGTSFGGVRWTTIIKGKGTEPTVLLKENTILCTFPVNSFIELMNSSDEGIEHMFNFNNGDTLLLTIEKDWKCIGREEIRNEGLFENPKMEKGAC